MNAPEIFRGKKKVKEYPDHVLYINKLRNKRVFPILGSRIYYATIGI